MKPHFVVFLTLIFDLVTIPFLPSTQVVAIIPNNQGEAIDPEVSRRELVAEYVPPSGLGTPPSTGGGTRGGKCEQDAISSEPLLTAIMPNSVSETAYGATVEAYPQFFFYVPTTSGRMAEFVIKDDDENDVYRTTFPISGQSGIVGLSLPKDKASLEVGKDYHWYFSVICNPKSRRQSIFVEGWSRRIAISPTLATKLQQAAPRDRARLYAQAGIWHEALATLVEERRKAPQDPTLAAEWKTLLESAGLKQIVDFPITFTALESSL